MVVPFKVIGSFIELVDAVLLVLLQVKPVYLILCQGYAFSPWQEADSRGITCQLKKIV